MYEKGSYLIFKEHMNLREKPTAASKTIDVVLSGSTVDVFEVNDNWGKILYNGHEGWVCISECFAKKNLKCENDECGYYEMYKILEKKYQKLLNDIKNIKNVLE